MKTLFNKISFTISDAARKGCYENDPLKLNHSISMGLLSDPSITPRHKFAKILIKYHSKLGWLLYVASIVWFCCLGHKDLNHGTYLSENALSPGLVYPEIKQDSSRWAQQLMDELKAERETHKTTTPHSWILAKMKQIGLETYVHNYTLSYPFAGGKEFHGKNVYGILRAPRTSSTEGVIFSSPYRPPSSFHTDITASVPVLLAFADFARRKNYWAKDIIFLVTEQEQLGMHAFLEAYFNTEMDKTRKNNYVYYGNLPARAGSLQAALNIEVQDLDIDYIDVKIEGLNGQLPNLDMFNLVQLITAREGIISGYKQTPFKKRRSSQYTSMESNVKNLLIMLLSQSTGIPNGNHGLFHRHRIESLTLEAIKRPNTGSNRYNGVLPLLKIMEGISRSLNNLLERFHQSYFFYILAQNDRFVSIGDYMPCLALMVFPLFIKSFLMWLIAGGQIKNAEEENLEEEIVEDSNAKAHTDFQVAPAILFTIYACAIGYMCQQLFCLDLVVNFLSSFGLTTAQSVTLYMVVWVVIAIVLPFLKLLPVNAMHWIHIASLLGLGTALVVIGLLNFALAFLIALICVPLAISIKPDMQKGFRKSILTAYCILLNPLVFIYGLIFILTLFQFPELMLKEIALRAVIASMDAITFSLTDNLIYNNWLCPIFTLVLLPLWCSFWTLVLNKCRKEPIISANKKLD